MARDGGQPWDVEVLEERPAIDGPIDLTHWKRIVATGLPWKVRDRRTGIVLLLCPPASLIVGSSPEEFGHQSDETLCSVRIGRPFYLGQTAVTQSQWLRVMANNPSVHEGPALPVDNVSAWQCLEFAASCGAGFRFPSEAEWEYAARAGSGTAFSHASDIDPELVNFNGHHPYPGGQRGLKRGGPVEVGSLAPNRWGFHEMLGNVWEWCSALRSRVGAEDRIDTVLRGGSWGNHAFSCRCASRIVRMPEYRRMTAGFRIARDVEPGPTGST
jgi:formylglycine-generating enzyme required for sulfatase activity